MTRIYFPHALKINTVITLDEPSSRHILTVLRLKPGELLQIFNGEGGSFQAKLQTVQNKRAVVILMEWLPNERESPLPVHLGQAISRGERMDFTVQKSVELGVSEITPLFTERCGVQLDAQRSANRLRHWQQIAVSAAEQCGRCRVPQINPPQSLSEFLKRDHGLGLICSPVTEPINLATLVQPPSAVSLLIGPEGGFSPTEIELAQRAGFQALWLGPRILRTETAAITALTLLQSRWGDLLSS